MYIKAVTAILTITMPFATSSAHAAGPEQTTVTPPASQGGASEPTDFRAMRIAGEAAIRSRLIDPASAQFEWPHGFLQSSWETYSKKKPAVGYVTCGFVNSRNRMGGYTGKVAFVVVINSGVVTYTDIGNGRGPGYDMIGLRCAKSAPVLPAPQDGMLTTASGYGLGIADELAKISKLRDSGALSSAEFETQKRKLLSN